MNTLKGFIDYLNNNAFELRHDTELIQKYAEKYMNQKENKNNNFLKEFNDNVISSELVKSCEVAQNVFMSNEPIENIYFKGYDKAINDFLQAMARDINIETYFMDRNFKNTIYKIAQQLKEQNLLEE